MKLFILLLFSLIFFSGCIKEESRDKDIEQTTSRNNEIKVINENWLKNKIESRNGKILFINFWATWCVPCVEEFPDLVKIYKENKNSDFEFLSVSVDLPSEIESKVKPFLAKQSADFPVVVVEEKRSEKIINFINPDWSGAVPVTVIYDKKGKRRDFITQPEDYAFFSKKINNIKNELE